MTRLFIAEKPSAGKALAAELGVTARKQGYIECKDGNVVTWGSDPPASVSSRTPAGITGTDSKPWHRMICNVVKDDGSGGMSEIWKS